MMSERRALKPRVVVDPTRDANSSRFPSLCMPDVACSKPHLKLALDSRWVHSNSGFGIRGIPTND